MIDNNKKTHLIVTGRGGGDQVQADWNQTDTEQPDYIKNKPELATVATSGSYNDLTDKPTIPTQVQADWNETDTTDPSYIQNKPTILTEWFGTQAEYDLIDPKDPNTVYHIEGGAPVQSNWNESDNTSLAYIQNKPTIPAAQVNSDWNASSGVAQILNKPSLATVATSGNYSDLNGTPSLATVATSGDYDDLTNKPTIPVVPTNVSAFTNDAGYTTFDGDYNSLTNKPTIPAAQVNSDWNASSGVAQILNKPTLATVATTGSYNDLTDKPTVTQEQADWNQSDTTAVDYIKNKPNITPTPPMSTETLTFTLQGGTTKTVEFYTVPNYFYVEDVSGSNNTLTIKNASNTNPVEVFKSTDRTNWTSMGTTNSTGITATIPANSKLFLKATTNNFGGEFNANIIKASGNHNVGGNTMSLIYGDSFENKTVFPTGSDSNLSNLFYDNTKLINANNLELPATTLTAVCYYQMFQRCTNLVTAPQSLPATTLTVACYSNMFDGCSSLTTAPVISGTIHANNCCQGMFRNCRALTTTPVLLAATLKVNSYTDMFNGCINVNTVTTYAQDISAGGLTNWLNNVTATGDFFNLGGATYTSGASGIPSGWTEHTSL